MGSRFVGTVAATVLGSHTRVLGGETAKAGCSVVVDALEAARCSEMTQRTSGSPGIGGSSSSVVACQSSPGSAVLSDLAVVSGGSLGGTLGTSFGSFVGGISTTGSLAVVLSSFFVAATMTTKVFLGSLLVAVVPQVSRGSASVSGSLSVGSGTLAVESLGFAGICGGSTVVGSGGSVVFVTTVQVSSFRPVVTTRFVAVGARCRGVATR